MAFRTIVKHSYVPAARDALTRMKAHVRYLKHRPGHDLEEGDRDFFNDRAGAVSKTSVLKALEDSEGFSRVTAHKLILSPGVPNVDLKNYVRSVMQEIGRSKGLDLTWFAIKHENTNHLHAHIVVLPKDLNGRAVRFTKADYLKIKESGDKHLTRMRLLTKEKETVKERNKGASVTDFFNRLASGVKKAFAILKQQVVSEETEPNAGGTGRKESEADFIGTAPSYWQLAAMREATDEKRKQREWKKYSRPLVVHNLEGAQDETSKLFTPRTPISSLRRLERLYLSGDANVTKQLAAHEMVRLQGWIRDQYRETKNVERNAEKVKSIKIELSAEENLQVDRKSDYLTLKNFKLRHMRGEVHLQDHEFKALSQWLANGPRPREPSDS